MCVVSHGEFLRQLSLPDALENALAETTVPRIRAVLRVEKQALSLELFASAEHLMPAPGMDMDKVSRLKRRLKRSVAETPAPGEPPSFAAAPTPI